MIQKICEVCSVSFSVIPCRELTAKYCSKVCSAKSRVSVKESSCSECGTMFHRKPSHRNKNYSLGMFCSITCMAKFMSVAYLGENNPNNRNRLTCPDGYRIYSPQASTILTGKKIKVHTAVAMEVLGIKAIPKGFHVHHRDCDVMNNTPENLAMLSVSDHVWLHKQFGSASLWAYSREKVSLDSLVSWSQDHERASLLLTTNLLTQKKSNATLTAAELSETERGTGGFGSTDKKVK